MKTPILATLAVALAFPLCAQSARPMLAAGHAFTAALHTNGTVYQWGDWNCRSIVDHSVPELIPGLTGVTAIAAGKGHLLALLADGTVLTLGRNSDGQLGHGDFADSCTPAPVTGLSGVVAIAASAFTSYAVLSNKTIVSWGDSTAGALGAIDNDRSLPGPGTNLTDVTTIASGGDSSFALAIKAPGTVWGWGDNLQKQLGFDTVASSTAVEGTSGVLNSARRIATGNYSSAASMADGGVYTWGWNSNGELGSGVIGGPDRITPGRVIGLTGILEIGSGMNHVLAVRYDGIVVAWGDGTVGQLGDNGSAPRTSPVVVVGFTNAVQAVGGYAHSEVLTADGGVWGFGLGFDGAVGDGTFTLRRAPVSVVGAGKQGLLNLGPVAPIVPTLDTDNDGIPDIIEEGESLNRLVKDNDVFESARLFAMQQYRDFLGREGDSAGVDAWTDYINGGGTRAAVTEGFFSSGEFQGTGSPVVRLYFAYFLRIPDYAGLTFWMNYFRSGHSLIEISNAFAGSQEFVDRYGTLANDQFVDLVYQNVLNRPPDAGGRAYWIGQLDGGLSRGEMMTGLSESAEFGANILAETYVTMMYVGMLRRAPDSNGFSFWVNYLESGNSGQALINGFLVTPEYHDRFLP